MGEAGRPERQVPATGIGKTFFFFKFESHPGLGLCVSLLHDRQATAHTSLGNKNETRVWGVRSAPHLSGEGWAGSGT